MAAKEMKKDLRAFLQAVAGESRQKILLLFVNGKERTAGDIVRDSGLSQPAASVQLGILTRSGLLLRRKEGRDVFYRPDRARIIENLDRLSSFLKGCC